MQGPCHLELQRALEKIAKSQQKLGDKLTRFYLPNCDKHGLYKPKQVGVFLGAFAVILGRSDSRLHSAGKNLTGLCVRARGPSLCQPRLYARLCASRRRDLLRPHLAGFLFECDDTRFVRRHDRACVVSKKMKVNFCFCFSPSRSASPLWTDRGVDAGV